MHVPRELMDPFIGLGGEHIKELQRQTSCTIKVGLLFLRFSNLFIFIFFWVGEGVGVNSQGVVL